MKSLLFCASLVGLGLVLMASSTATSSAPIAPRHACCAVDDPPPEPVDCPLCGGNAMVHVQRLFAIQKKLNLIAARVTRY